MDELKKKAIYLVDGFLRITTAIEEYFKLPHIFYVLYSDKKLKGDVIKIVGTSLHVPQFVLRNLWWRKSRSCWPRVNGLLRLEAQCVAVLAMPNRYCGQLDKKQPDSERRRLWV